jgi:hypothetical protein
MILWVLVWVPLFTAPGVPENRPDWVMPALAGSPTADCSEALERPYDTLGRSWLRSGSARLGYRSGNQFIPLVYFTSRKLAMDCAESDSGIQVYDGKAWK